MKSIKIWIHYNKCLGQAIGPKKSQCVKYVERIGNIIYVAMREKFFEYNVTEYKAKMMALTLTATQLRRPTLVHLNSEKS